MMTLRVAGALGRCGTFAVPLDLDRIGPGSVTRPSRIAFYREIAESARAAGDLEVARTAERATTPAPAPRGRRVGRWFFQKAGWMGRKVLGR
jgi:hypothetical protein